MAASRHSPEVKNYIFVVPRIALRYVCGPNNINITKLPSLCGAHAFIDPAQIMKHYRMVNIVLSGPEECQIRALGELSYCLMNFNANMKSRSFKTHRPEPYDRNHNRHFESPTPKTRSANDDGEIVEEKADPY